MLRHKAFSGSLSRFRSAPQASTRISPVVHRISSLKFAPLAATKTDGPVSKQFSPKDAREAVEIATKLQNEQKDYDEAIKLYVRAMEMNPNEDEARAALYNMGCALAKLKQWARATDCIVQAINKYNLKLVVALKDDDLKELRDRREWLDALMEMKGGLSRNTKIDLRSEAKAPFRFPRLILFGGLGIGAAVGLFIITFRLIKAFQGGEGAPDVTETLQNFGINSVAVVVLGLLVYRDLQTKSKAVAVTEREEILGRLQVDLGGARQLPLIRLRGQVRPVILCGSRAYVEASIREADPLYQQLRARGVSVVPVIIDEVDAARREKKLASNAGDPDAKIKALKKEFQAAREKEAAATKGFGKGESETVVKKEEEVMTFLETDRKWRLVAYNILEWKEWLDEQRKFAGMPDYATDIYVQVQLDGTVRSSGRGMVNWQKLVDDLPPLDSVRTTMMDGIGPSEV